MLTTKYNFDNNLIKASYNKNISEAKNEWVVISKDIKDDKSGLCICQRHVKHIIYMYNLKTKLTIMVGSKCAKKFEMQRQILPCNIIRKILSNNLIKGSYEIIDNIIIYSNNIEKQFQKYYNDLIENNCKNKDKLIIIKNEIKELIDKYELNYLNLIYINLINKIATIEQQLLKEQQLIKEQRILKEQEIIKQWTMIRKQEQQKNELILEQKTVKEQQKDQELLKEQLYIIRHQELFKIIKENRIYNVKTHTIEKLKTQRQGDFYNYNVSKYKCLTLDDCYKYIDQYKLQIKENVYWKKLIGLSIDKIYCIKNNIDLLYNECVIIKLEILFNKNIINTYYNSIIELKLLE